jgi:hypothetical protein
LMQKNGKSQNGKRQLQISNKQRYVEGFFKFRSVLRVISIGTPAMMDVMTTSISSM